MSSGSKAPRGSGPDASASSSLPARLGIKKRSGVRLTAAQAAFNRLVRGIEEIRVRHQQAQTRLDADLVYYHEELRPIEAQLRKADTELVLALHGFLKAPEFSSRSGQADLRSALLLLLDSLEDDFGGFSDPDLQRISDELRPEGDDEDENLLLPDEVRAELQRLADAFGIDLAAEGIDLSLPERELGKRIQALMQKIDREGPESVHRKPGFEAGGPGLDDLGQGGAAPGGAGRKERKKSKRTLAKEERERVAAEMRDKDVGQMYKQLAKLLHPDLEPDPERRQQKEEAMKRLTVAREAGDLHTMLQLELEWMERESADVSRLGEDRLKIYNAVLKEQFQELQRRFAWMLDDPRYIPLRRLGMLEAVFEPGERAFARDDMEVALGMARRRLARLRGAHGVKAAKEFVEILVESGEDVFGSGPYGP